MALLRCALQLICQNGISSICISFDTAAQNAQSEEGTSLDVVFAALQIFINGFKSFIDVPDLEKTE